MGNLSNLVAKVEAKEEKRLAAEEADEELVDSDDGMHKVNKKKKKKKKKMEVTVEEIQEKITKLMDETMVNRATMKKDFSLLEGNFIATKEMDPVIERFEAMMELDEDEYDEEVMRAAFEVMLGGLDKSCKLFSQLSNVKMQLVETMRIVDRITTLKSPQQLLDDCEWVNGL